MGNLFGSFCLLLAPFAPPCCCPFRIKSAPLTSLAANHCFHRKKHPPCHPKPDIAENGKHRFEQDFRKLGFAPGWLWKRALHACSVFVGLLAAALPVLVLAASRFFVRVVVFLLLLLLLLLLFVLAFALWCLLFSSPGAAPFSTFRRAGRTAPFSIFRRAGRAGTLTWVLVLSGRLSQPSGLLIA